MFDVNNYKGVYFRNDSKEQKFYEGGAHFKYKELYKVLENIALNKSKEKKGISEEPKKNSKFKYFDNNLNENISRNIKNIKPLIDSLTQKLSEITKNKSNRNYYIEKPYSFLDKNNNNFINKQSRNFKQYVPNNSKAHIKKNNNTYITYNNINSNKKINGNTIKEDLIIKNKFDFGNNIFKKIRNNDIKIKGKKILNRSQGKNNNSRNHFNNNTFDLIKTGNITKEIMNKTTNIQNYIPMNPVNNYKNHSNSLSSNKNKLEKQKNSFNFTNSSIVNNNNNVNNRNSFSINKSKISIQKKIINQKNRLIMNQKIIPKKRQLLMNMLKKKNLSYKQLNILKNDNKSKSNIDIINNNINPNNNYVEISLLSDLNTPHSKKKNSNHNFSNLNNDYIHNLSNNNLNQNNITANNNIILKPKINISFVNNIKTITTPLINKSRNKHLGEGINLGTLLKKGLLTDIYKTSNSNYNSNKKTSYSNYKDKMKNTSSFKRKNNRTPVNKLSRNMRSEQKLKNSFTLTEQYLKMQKKTNIKYKCIPKNTSNIHKINTNKFLGKNPPRKRSYLNKNF